MMARMMMRFMKKNILNFILSEVVSDNFRRSLVNKINKAVNIPGLNEQEERAIIARIIDGTTDTLTDHFS